MINYLHILHLAHRTDRYESFQNELVEQGIDNWEVAPGIIVPQLPFVGISRAHKRIVAMAKAKGYDTCTIMEDDVKFTAKGAWRHYVESEPKSYDLYLGSVYDASISPNRKILFGFSALSLYTVSSRFYDTFLGMKEMNNLDKELGRFSHRYEYIVCHPEVCYQMGGFSDHQQKEVANYDKYHVGKQFFGINS